MADKPYLLSDDEIISFIIHGSHIVEPDFPEGFNESIYEELEALDIQREQSGRCEFWIKFRNSIRSTTIPRCAARW